MTERKPPVMTFTSWIDQQINEAAERGAFDNLPGAGKPLPCCGDSGGDGWVADAACRVARRSSCRWSTKPTWSAAGMRPGQPPRYRTHRRQASNRRTIPSAAPPTSTTPPPMAP